jgi:defect-in-organelle-trafficking protein DotC
MRVSFLGLLCLSLLSVVTLLWSPSSSAQERNFAPPPSLPTLQHVKPESAIEEAIKQPPSLRREALINAALSYGARGGLARRLYEIQQELDGKAAYLDRTYNFNQLLIRGPSGVLIEPPVVSEGQDALIIEDDGQTAAVAELLLNINKNARIVSTGRNWRNYLERTWEEVAPPPDLLLPRNEEERMLWIKNVRKGWDEGYKQGDEVFQADLDRLAAHFEGMVRYRMLLKQNMISAPYALLEERGVTGGGSQMRVGDRAITITGPSQLNSRAEEWQPANR